MCFVACISDLHMGLAACSQKFLHWTIPASATEVSKLIKTSIAEKSANMNWRWLANARVSNKFWKMCLKQWKTEIQILTWEGRVNVDVDCFKTEPKIGKKKKKEIQKEDKVN